MAIVYVLLGSNTGDKEDNLKKAGSMISRRVGDLKALSAIYETEPWGFTENTENFYNQAIKINTPLEPEELIHSLLGIEAQLGRKREKEGYHDRIIDIDILFYDDRIIQTDILTVPHPRMHARRFSLKVLNEIAGSFIHPVFKKEIRTLLKECKDNKKVRRL
ncbi:Bifunctional folate synthesis protein [subsurface metagenome]